MLHSVHVYQSSLDPRTRHASVARSALSPLSLARVCFTIPSGMFMVLALSLNPAPYPPLLRRGCQHRPNGFYQSEVREAGDEPDEAAQVG